MAQANKPDTPGKVPILIDGQKVHPDRGSLSGSDIRMLVSPPLGTDRDLWLDEEGSLDTLVEDGDVVELRPQMRFFTVPRVINPGGDPHAAPF